MHERAGSTLTTDVRGTAPARAPRPQPSITSLIGNRQASRMFSERIGPPDDRVEREAERAAETVDGHRPRLSAAGGPVIRRKCDCGGTCAHCREEEENTIRRAPRDRGVENEPAPQSGQARALIVEDSEKRVPPGAMRKRDFLDKARAAVTETAGEARATVGQRPRPCPYIDRWFGYYARRSAAQLERALAKFAPETAAVRSAQEYIVLLRGRVRRGMLSWLLTGRISGIPEGAPLEPGERMETPAEKSPEKVAFQSLPGGAAAANPVSVRSQLGGGRALEGDVRSRMESAFGFNFGGVRIHTDSRAADLNHELNARAFTIGRDVAFGPGEFQPGTLAGDALLAHELAHVVQQNGGSAGAAEPADTTADQGYEQEASDSAAGAMLRMIEPGAKDRVQPASRFGLRLQRCGTGDCPSGYAWQVVNRMATGVACVCTWRCLKGVPSGTAISGREQGPPLLGLPSPIRRSGALTARKGYFEPQCSCTTPKDVGGAVIQDWEPAEPDYDVMQPLGAAAGTAEAKANIKSVGENLNTRGKDTGAEVRRAEGKPKEPPAKDPMAALKPPPTAPVTPKTPAPAPRTLTKVTTTNVEALKKEGFVFENNSADGRTAVFRHPDTGQKAIIQLQRGGPSWISPAWGRSRLETELRNRGFVLLKPTKGEGGLIYRNAQTREEIRIMPRPSEQFRNEPIEKHLNGNYYRYRSGPDQEWGTATTIIDKDTK